MDTPAGRPTSNWVLPPSTETRTRSGSPMNPWSADGAVLPADRWIPWDNEVPSPEATATMADWRLLCTIEGR